MKKTVGMALASLLAVLVLSGQALGHRSMLSVLDDPASAYDYFTQLRQKISSDLGVSLDQIGTVGYNPDFGVDNTLIKFELLPESDSFKESEVDSIKETLKSGDLGTMSDFTDDEDTPGALDITITTSDDEGVYDAFVHLTKQASSALGISQDQIDEVDVSVKRKCTYVNLVLLPESDSFEASEVKRINDTLHDQYPGEATDLSYDEDYPGTLDASYIVGDQDCDLDSGDTDYMLYEVDATSTGARKLLSDPFFDDDDLYYYYYVEYDIYYYFD